MINDLITYLQANCPSFNSIEHAITSEPVDELSTDAPILFVSLGDEDAEENELLNAVSQRVEIQINLVIVALTSAIESLRNELRTAVLAHEPTDYEMIEFVSSNRLEIRGGYEWREIIYKTATYYRS